MSEVASPNRPLRLVAYGGVALAIAFELAVVWFALHPQVPPDYRAYYIDHSTTCLNQPISGDYRFGTTVSFRSEGGDQAKPLRVCGWEGPAGDGTHAVGTSARLRFALPGQLPDRVHLTLELVAITHDGYPSQHVMISANGKALTTAIALAGIPLTVDIDVPADVVGVDPGSLDLVLTLPDAIRMAPGDSDTRMRSIKLLSARLGPAQ